MNSLTDKPCLFCVVLLKTGARDIDFGTGNLSQSQVDQDGEASAIDKTPNRRVKTLLFELTDAALTLNGSNAVGV